MAVTTGPRVGTTRWSANSDPQTRTHFDNSHAAIEDVVAVYAQDVRSARPAPGIEGRYFWATDESIVYYDDGTAWTKIADAAAIPDAAWTSLALVSGYNSGAAKWWRAGGMVTVDFETSKTGSPTGAAQVPITTVPSGIIPAGLVTFPLFVNQVACQTAILPVSDPNAGDVVLYSPGINVGQTIRGSVTYPYPL
jgi:hypothetical protein